MLSDIKYVASPNTSNILLKSVPDFNLASQKARESLRKSQQQIAQITQITQALLGNKDDLAKGKLTGLKSKSIKQAISDLKQIQSQKSSSQDSTFKQ